ncbi:MAG: methyltransferase domain-containing protein [Anaerolineae bacterium]|nr:methyltransferase domain-containing protein [Anaerolineae bacterium]
MSFVQFNEATEQAHVNAARVNPTSYLSTFWLVKKMALTRRFGRGRLLDVGCSSKPYRPFFATDAHIGIDWPQTIHQNTQIDVFSDASQLPFRDQAFDTILCTEVLEHLRTPQQALNEMARVSMPGSYLILSVPFTFRLHETPHDYFRYSPFALRFLLEEAGYEVVELHTRGGTMTVWCDILFRAVGSSLSRLFRATGLRGGALRALQAVFIIAPQWGVANLVFALHKRLPGLARQLDPSDQYTLGYVVIARKADVRNRR